MVDPRILATITASADCHTAKTWPPRPHPTAKNNRISGPKKWGQKMAPFVGVYMFCSTSGAAEKWPHFSFPKTEKKWPRSLSHGSRVKTSERQWRSDLFVKRCQKELESKPSVLPALKNQQASKSEHETINSMTRWMITMIRWLGLPFLWGDDLIRWWRVMRSTQRDVYHVDLPRHRWLTMESPEPQFNAKEGKGLSEKRVLKQSVGSACWPFSVFCPPRGPEQERPMYSFKTLKALTCSPVPGACFLTNSIGQLTGTKKKC